MIRTFVLLLWLIHGLLSLSAQSVYISRLVPGNPGNPQDVLHRIELFNQSDQYADLSRYLVVTRYFAIRLPANTYLPPYSRLRLGRNAFNGDLNIELKRLREWKVREPGTEEEGDFVALLTAGLDWLDGFYYSPLRRINFLPTEDRVRTAKGESIRVQLPDETDGRWDYLRARQDPAMAMVCIDGRWRPNSRTRNLLPAVQYRDLSTKFVDGIVNIRWRTEYERDCFFHTLERSTDGRNFRVVERVSGPVNSSRVSDYLAYDTGVEKDRVYYYRVSVVDKFGHTIHSSVSRIRTEELSGDFTFDIIRAGSSDQRSFDVRFSSKNEQRVRVKLMDEQLREISVLFYGKVEAERQNLINYRDGLSAGKYYLIVATERRRYYEPIVVE
jgi:hypothetical protein